MLESLRDGRDFMMSGVQREVYVESVAKHLLEVLHRRGGGPGSCGEEEAAGGRREEGGRKVLSSFSNRTATTSLTKCATLVLVPNRGIVDMLLHHLLGGLVKDGNLGGHESAFLFCGDPQDECRVGLKRTPGGEIVEVQNMYDSDVILATPLAILATRGRCEDPESNRSEENELGGSDDAPAEEAVHSELNISLSEKMGAGVFDFLSSVSLCIVLDLHILYFQDLTKVSNVLYLVKNSRVRNLGRTAMHINQFSSGEEKKTVKFFSAFENRDIRKLFVKHAVHGAWSREKVVEGVKRSRPVLLFFNRERDGGGPSGQLGGEGLSGAGLGKRSAAYCRAFEFHVRNILGSPATDGATVVVIKNYLYEVLLKHVLLSTFSELFSKIEGRSPLVFVNEYFSRSKADKKIKLRKSVVVVTERFFFYNHERMEVLLKGMGARRAMFMDVPTPFIFEKMAAVLERQEPRFGSPSSVYSTQLIVNVTKEDRCELEALFGSRRRKEIEAEMDVLDYKVV